MTNWCWLNGEYVPEADARISPFDRGFVFGDAVYEVTSLLDGGLIDVDRHLERLERSLGEIGMSSPMSRASWEAVLREVAQRNGVRDGFVYQQVTRGVADRDFAFPRSAVPTMFVFARAKDYRADPLAGGVVLHAVPDIRWSRRDIKSTSLLAQVLAKQAARGAGAHEAIMHVDGVVTEGGSSNVWIVRDGVLITRPLSNDILAGVTRSVVPELADAAGVRVEERPFTLDEACAADEVMITSATSFVLPVVRIDACVIGGGVPGVVTMDIRGRYIARAEAGARVGGALSAERLRAHVP